MRRCPFGTPVRHTPHKTLQTRHFGWVPLSASALAVAALLALPACSGSAAGNGKGGGRGGRGGPDAAVAVHTTQVGQMVVQRFVDLAGTLISPDEAKVSAEAAGVVRQTLVEIGTEVRVGQPLVRLEPRELTLALQRAEASLRQTRAQLGMHGPPNTADAPPPDEEIATVRTATANREDARLTFERAKTLSARGIMSPVDLQTAETRYKLADAAYQSALDSVRATKAILQDRRAAYDLAAKQLDDAVVKAPIAGSIVERPVMVGEYIAARTPVATIVQMHPLKLRTGVQERHAGIVTVGQPVEFRVESFGERLFTGKVAYVSPALEQTMRTFTVEALVDNQERLLKPGFFAKGRILTTQEKVMAVPDTAVSVLAGVASVYVLEDNVVTQQTVTLGVREGDQWEIVEGLKGHETLATNRLNELASGTTVRMLKPGESEVVPAAAEEPPGAGAGERGAGRGRGGRGQAGRGPQGGEAR